MTHLLSHCVGLRPLQLIRYIPWPYGHGRGCIGLWPKPDALSRRAATKVDGMGLAPYRYKMLHSVAL
ncbi:hypothetical protein RMSM_03814 [Rhodopirellula maiorica SM1]|uniref:Uncharacterized protein n=1 Tax=Rhodopirellula maiorica SM1 TaxID=1265738 RepID=M5RJ82_9BACT|nr:hypothetical protein RMSM_03814 [Rhodopirellula maiorica SM1]